jgi:subtilisin family serine protease
VSSPQQRVTYARQHHRFRRHRTGRGTAIGALAAATGLVTGLVAGLVTGVPGAAAAVTPAPLLGTSAPGVIPGQYVVVLKDGPEPPAGLSAASSTSSASSRALVSRAVTRARRSGAVVTQQYTHALRGYGGTLDAAELAQVRADPAVAYVQANQRYRGGTVQVDPPWGLDRIDQRGRTRNGAYAYAATGAGVTAYVVDTGIRGSHLDFTTNPAGNTVPSRVVDGISKLEDDTGTADCLGHGTHVAGTIGGLSYGVAKEVTLVPVRVLDCDGVSSSQIVAEGLDWIVAHHGAAPAVANLSLTNEGGEDTVVEAAVARLINDGVTTVIAAGNGVYDKAVNDYVGVGACSVSPSRVRAAITVGATTKSDQRAGFSNYGSCVDLYAPGVDIESDSYVDDDLVVTMSGTSMAAPHVAGVAALYLQAHPTATPAEVQAALIAAASADRVTNVSTKWPRRLLFSLPKVTPPAATTTAGAITTGTALLRGSKICSPNTLYCLSQQESDGKLVLSKPGGRVLWTNNRAAAWTTVDAGGNLVSYDAYGQWIWSSHTARVGASTLRVTDLGNLSLVNNTTAAVEWVSGPAQKPAPTQAVNTVSTLSISKALYRSGSRLRSPNGIFTFGVRSNGDLVLAKTGVTIWHSGAKDGDWLTLQPDGNLTYRRSDGTVVWKSGTGGQGAARLTVRDSGNLVLVRLSDQKVLWSTNTQNR